MAYRRKGKSYRRFRRTRRRRYVPRRRYRKAGRYSVLSRKVGRILRTMEVKTMRWYLTGSFSASNTTFNDAEVLASVMPNIPIGSLQNQRIGAKVSPIKLRVFGTIDFNFLTIQASSSTDASIAPGYNGVSIGVRHIIYQVRSANGANSPYEADTYSNYHPMAVFPNASNEISNNDIAKVLNAVGTSSETNVSDMLYIIGFRKGITRQGRILSDRKFMLNGNSTGRIDLRYKTRLPRTLEWLEDKTGNIDYNVNPYPHNNIYSILIFSYPMSFVTNVVGSVNATFRSVTNYTIQYELQYKDA